MWLLLYNGKTIKIKLTVVNQFMRLQGVGLCESHLAVIAFIWFLMGMRSHVALQFECVGRGIRAVLTLKKRYVSLEKV